jgi:hypothetical protein
MKKYGNPKQAAAFTDSQEINSLRFMNIQIPIRRQGICMVIALMNCHVVISPFMPLIIHGRSQPGKVMKYEGKRRKGAEFKAGCLNEQISAKQLMNDRKYEMWDVSGSKNPSSVRHSI